MELILFVGGAIALIYIFHYATGEHKRPPPPSLLAGYANYTPGKTIKKRTSGMYAAGFVLRLLALAACVIGIAYWWPALLLAGLLWWLNLRCWDSFICPTCGTPTTKEADSCPVCGAELIHR